MYYFIASLKIQKYFDLQIKLVIKYIYVYIEYKNKINLILLKKLIHCNPMLDTTMSYGL